MKPIESKEVTLIWANDGWCYIPELRIRQKFTEKYYYNEDWSGVIALPEYIENITWVLYSKEPRVWQEKGAQYNEIYSTKSQRRSNNSSVPGKPIK